MGVVIKQSFWGTAIAYLGVMVGYLNTLYVRIEYLDFSQIGLFTLITANAMIFSTVSSFGANSSFLKFFASFNEENKNRFFSFLFLVTLLGNLIILTIGYFSKDFIAARYADSAPDYINFISITAMIIIANSFFDLFFSYSRTIMKVIFPSFLRDIYLRAGALFLVLGYAAEWWNFPAAVVGLGISYILAFIFLFLQLVIKHRLRFDFSFKFITKAWRIKLLKFGSYSMLMTGSFALINNISYDQITAILGSDMNGIFVTCFFIAVIVEMPKRNMGKIIAPIISREIEMGNIQEVGNLYKKSSISMSVIGTLLFIGIVTNLQDLLDFIPKGESLQTGFYVVLSVCLAKLMLMVSSFSGEIINFSPNYKYNLIFQLLAVFVLIISNSFLIPILGINGAGLSYLITLTFHITLKFLYVKHLYGIHPFVKEHLPLLVIGIITGIGALFFEPKLHPVINIGLRSILTTIIYTLLVYRFEISTDINRIIHSTFERFFKLNLPK